MNTLEPEGHPALGSFQTAARVMERKESPVGRTGTSAAKMKALDNKPKPSSPAYKDTSPADLPMVKNKKQTKRTNKQTEWLIQPWGLGTMAVSRHSLGLFLSWCHFVASGHIGDENFSVPNASVFPQPGRGAHATPRHTTPRHASSCSVTLALTLSHLSS